MILGTIRGLGFIDADQCESKKRRKRRVDGESAGFAELQKIKATDRKKAAGRATAYVQYRTFLARRQVLQQYVTTVREEMNSSAVDTEDEKAAAAKRRQLLTQLEAEVKAMIEPQRKARVASSAPRLRVESRTKKGRLGPRSARKRVKAEITQPSREERFTGLNTEAVSRIEQVQDLMSFLLLKRGETAAATVVLRVVQLLVPLTGLPGGAMTREDLPSEAAMRHALGNVHLTASQWAGRQDIDLVALFTRHRQHYEQLSQLLMDWRHQRRRASTTLPDEEACAEQGCSLRASDRAAANAQQQSGLE